MNENEADERMRLRAHVLAVADQIREAGDPEGRAETSAKLDHTLKAYGRLEMRLAETRRLLREAEGEAADADYWREAYKAQLERANAATAALRKIAEGGDAVRLTIIALDALDAERKAGEQ